MLVTHVVFCLWLTSSGNHGRLQFQAAHQDIVSARSFRDQNGDFPLGLLRSEILSGGISGRPPPIRDHAAVGDDPVRRILCRKKFTEQAYPDGSREPAHAADPGSSLLRTSTRRHTRRDHCEHGTTDAAC